MQIDSRQNFNSRKSGIAFGVNLRLGTSLRSRFTKKQVGELSAITEPAKLKKMMYKDTVRLSLERANDKTNQIFVFSVASGNKYPIIHNELFKVPDAPKKPLLLRVWDSLFNKKRLLEEETGRVFQSCKKALTSYLETWEAETAEARKIS